MPEKEISMEMRILLAFALSALVLVVFAPRPSPKAPGTTAGVKQTATPQALAPSTASQKTAAPTSSAPAPAVAPMQSEVEGDLVLESDLYEVRFTNRGGAVKSWILKAYKDIHGKPLDLVNTASFGAPLTVWTDDPALRQQINSALFVSKLSSPRAPATISFEYSDGTIYARKKLTFEHGSYVVGMESEVRKGGAPVAHELVWLGGFGDHTIAQAHLSNQITLSANGKHEHQPNKDIKGESRPGGPFSFAGIEDLFFTAIFMPGDDAALPVVPAAHIFRNEFQPPATAQTPQPAAIPEIGIGAGGAGFNRFRTYVGPKDLDILKSVYPDPRGADRARRGEQVTTLAELIDFGWFSMIAVPLFFGLKWIFVHIVPNYGWAIVILTAVINFAMLPLKISSMKSAMKMQKVQPQILAIQNKYKKYKFNDPKRQDQNQEVMDLYKKHGINPLGGCLPLLLQMPFLIGFYKVLALAIEMRHAPWILWIQDLSAPEVGAFKVLPILMIVTMVITQRMTPQTAADPVQQKMFMFMPIMFGVMFYNVSSGLVLYWLIGNVVQIAQQWYINKTELRPAPAAAK